jgi:hypothetical protein
VVLGVGSDTHFYDRLKCTIASLILMPCGFVPLTVNNFLKKARETTAVCRPRSPPAPAGGEKDGGFSVSSRRSSASILGLLLSPRHAFGREDRPTLYYPAMDRPRRRLPQGLATRVMRRDRYSWVPVAKTSRDTRPTVLPRAKQSQIAVHDEPKEAVAVGAPVVEPAGRLQLSGATASRRVLSGLAHLPLRGRHTHTAPSDPAIPTRP